MKASVVLRRRPEDRAFVVEDQGARAARADVDAQNRNGEAPLSLG
jgi:hypothetical protein